MAGLTDQNRLSLTHPELAAQWHPTKNGSLTPADVSCGSGRKVWWKCPVAEDHEWEAVIASRVRVRGCSCCSNYTVVLSNCLATTHPELAAQWHPTKNGSLTSYDVTSGSGKKVWWKCLIDNDHEWEASVSNRVRLGSRCGCCYGDVVVLSNCLATTHPELAAQWHPAKNGSLTPYDVTFGSHKKVWWKCPKADDHDWESPVSDRGSSGNGCACCHGLVVVPSNCLATIYPELVAQWHPTKNGSLTPQDVTFGSGRKVWWKCLKFDDHEWEAAINSRGNGTGCPFCANQRVSLSNCLATTHPELAAQWHPTKNGSLTPYDVVSGSTEKAWWKCPKVDDHEWEAVVGSRAQGFGCACCHGFVVVLSNCLATTHPELAAQWHPTKNGSLTPYAVTSGSGRKVWWKCPKFDDHEWEAVIASRGQQGNGCACCSGHVAVLSNCLATTHPELAAQWHPTKNESLTPYDVTFGSVKQVWWQCPIADDHEWKTSPNGRMKGQGRGCPCCAGFVVVLSNCLATTHPELATQWHPTKNGFLTPYDVIAGSHDKVWWQCPKIDDHEWSAVIKSRAGGDECGCPYCNESQGEKAVASILSQRGYQFEREVRFDDCKHRRSLPFDFLVWLPDGKPFLVEYHGKQHYETIRWRGSSRTDEEMNVTLEGVQKRDQIKKQYAEDNGVPLLVIPYWERDQMGVLIENFIQGISGG